MSMTVDAATNRLTGPGITYDAAGNLMTGAGKWFWHDELRRVADAMGETFVYGPRNERVLINKTDGTKELNIYGVDGLLYQVWKHNGTSWSNVASKERIYFGGRLMMIGGEKTV